MTDTLRHALRQDAGNVEIPTLDANDVIAQGERRLHRRRMTAALATVAAVAAIAVGSVLVTRADPNTQGPLPVAPPSSSTSTSGEGTRAEHDPLSTPTARRSTSVTRRSRRRSPSRSSTPLTTEPSTRRRSTARCGSPTAPRHR